MHWGARSLRSAAERASTQIRSSQSPHKTPANFRFDCTGTVARLRQQGDTDFQVSLVVLNIDGTPATDALHIDGVSLNFYD
jgi:hypothetical protein